MFTISLYTAKNTLEEHNLYMHTNSLCIIFASHKYVLITAINIILSLAKTNLTSFLKLLMQHF